MAFIVPIFSGHSRPHFQLGRNPAHLFPRHWASLPLSAPQDSTLKEGIHVPVSPAASRVGAGEPAWDLRNIYP